MFECWQHQILMRGKNGKKKDGMLGGSGDGFQRTASLYLDPLCWEEWMMANELERSTFCKTSACSTDIKIGVLKIMTA